MKDIFIADAHLKNPSDENYIQLLRFLKQNRGNIRTLVLLGDIFEFWMGYRYCVYSAYVPLLHELYALKQEGTSIVMVEGNHDFSVGPFFSDTLGARIIPEGGCIDLGKTRIWVEHGDCINASRSYLWLRKLFRSRSARILSRIIHPDLLWEIAAHLGSWSKKRRAGKISTSSRNKMTTSPPSPIPEKKITEAALNRSDLRCNAFICGHFHHGWHQQSSDVQILVVGEWGSLGTYAEHHAGVFSIRQFLDQSTSDPAA